MLWVIGTLVVVSFVLWFFFERTLLGKAMRACAENQRAASLMGVNVKKFVMISYFLGGALGAVGGMLVAPISFMVYDEGTMMGLKGFASAVLGGIGSYPGAVVGGLVLGLLESLSTGYVSSIFKDIMAFLVLLLILVIKPTGLMSGRVIPIWILETGRHEITQGTVVRSRRHGILDGRLSRHPFRALHLSASRFVGGLVLDPCTGDHRDLRDRGDRVSIW